MRKRRVALVLPLLALALALCGGACGERLSLGELPPAALGSDATADALGDAGSAFADADRDALLASDAMAPVTYVPCEGKSCGEGCSICPPGDTTCVESAEAKSCDLLGGCIEGSTSCGDGGWQPCVGKTCNDPCDPCDPQDPNCIVVGAVFVCSPVGKCAYLAVSGC